MPRCTNHSTSHRPWGRRAPARWRRGGGLSDGRGGPLAPEQVPAPT